MMKCGAIHILWVSKKVREGLLLKIMKTKNFGLLINWDCRSGRQLKKNLATLHQREFL